MDEWRENEGSPCVADSIAGSSEPSPFHLPGKIVDGARVPEEAPTVRFEAGRTAGVWHSPDAPLMTCDGGAVNAVPVDGLPQRLGWGRLPASQATLIAAPVVGLFATEWVAKRRAMRISVT